MNKMRRMIECQMKKKWRHFSSPEKVFFSRLRLKTSNHKTAKCFSDKTITCLSDKTTKLSDKTINCLSNKTAKCFSDKTAKNV